LQNYIDQYIDFYNNIRPHGSLKNYSPETFHPLTMAGNYFIAII